MSSLLPKYVPSSKCEMEEPDWYGSGAKSIGSASKLAFTSGPAKYKEESVYIAQASSTPKSTLQIMFPSMSAK